MRRAGVRTFSEAENYETDRKRRALEEGGARGDRAHARHRGRVDEDDPSILAQVGDLQFWCVAQLHHGSSLLGRHGSYRLGAVVLSRVASMLFRC
jgi:hypothetical protein